MSLTCHCYRCNVVEYYANTYFSLSNEDEQNLILQICKEIFKAIQDEKISTEISYNGSSMTHKQIHNIKEVENCIDKEFGQLFRNNILRKEIKRLSIGTWKVEFIWTGFNNDSLIKGLLKISRVWYNPFTKYLQRIENQKRDISKDEGKLKKYLLDNLKNYLPGFEYLLESSWKSDDNNDSYDVDFIFASDSGIFIVVNAKWLNVRNKSKGRKLMNVSHKDVRIQVSKYKNKVSEEFNGKYITVLGVKFMNDIEEEKVTLEFVNNDGLIAHYLKEIYGFSQSYESYSIPSKSHNKYQASLQNHDDFEASSKSYNNYQTSSNSVTQQVKDDCSTGSVTGAVSGVAAVVAAGYMIYQAISKKNDNK